MKKLKAFIRCQFSGFLFGAALVLGLIALGAADRAKASRRQIDFNYIKGEIGNMQQRPVAIQSDINPDKATSLVSIVSKLEGKITELEGEVSRKENELEGLKTKHRDDRKNAVKKKVRQVGSWWKKQGCINNRKREIKEKVTPGSWTRGCEDYLKGWQPRN